VPSTVVGCTSLSTKPPCGYSQPVVLDHLELRQRPTPNLTLALTLQVISTPEAELARPLRPTDGDGVVENCVDTYSYGDLLQSDPNAVPKRNGRTGPSVCIYWRRPGREVSSPTRQSYARRHSTSEEQ